MPNAVYALGVGQVRVQSALNQRLNAEMELFAVKPDELENLTVKISTQMLSGNISSQPSNFDYTIETRRGRYFLKLLSKQPMREPLLNFLIELEWPKGRLLRELAIFLDPPATSVDPTLTAGLPPPRQAPSLAPAKPVRTRPGGDSKSVVSRAGGTSTASQAAAAPTGEVVGNYGPVARGETLWRIASRLRPEGVSVQQMMQALYQNNPRAFSKPGLDYLMAGVTLQVPTVAGATPDLAAAQPKPAPASRPKAEEQVEIRLVPPSGQDTETQTASRPGSAGTEQEGGPTRLRIANLRDLQTRIQTAQSDNPEVLVAKSEPAAESAQAAETPVAETPVAEEIPAAETPAPQASTPADTATSATEAQASASDGQATDPAAPSELRLDTAALNTENAVDSAVSSESAATSETVVATAPVQPLQSEQIGAQQAIEPVVATEEGVTDAEPAAATPAEAALETGTEATDDSTEQAAAELQQPAVATVEMDREQPEAAGIDVVGMLLKFQRDPMGSLREIQQHPLGLPIAGGTLIVLLLLIATVSRRSRKAEDYSEIERGLALSTAASDSAGAASKAMRRSSPAEEPADLAAKMRLQRVDFLIAGRSYEEAEKVLRRLLSENPFDLKVKEKMLEVYYKSSNTDQFITVAESIRSQIDSEQSPLWQKVVDMGHKIYPGHPLFESSDEGEDTIIFAPQEDPSEQEDRTQVVQAAGAGEDRGMVLEFGQTSSIARAASKIGDSPDTQATFAPAATTTTETDETLSAPALTDLNEWRDEDSTTTTNAETLRFDAPDEQNLDFEKELAELPLDDRELSLDFASDRSESASAHSADQDNDDLALSLDMELGESLDFESNTAADKPTTDFDLDALALDESELRFSPDDSADSLSLEFEDANAVDAEDTQLISDALDGDATQSMDSGDYVEIKLDLASAYLEMDDRAGAISLLQEVVAEGSDGQKARAQELLDRLA
ncbi:MAG: FimV/HubP family polar landmark protein [Gammaproteobacteria bacterium]